MGIPPERPGAPLQTKFADWPELDRSLWAQASIPGDILTVDPPAASWRETTQTTVKKSYGRWLAWLSEAGLLAEAAAPRSRATPERVGAYIVYLRAYAASYTVATYVQGLAMALDAMAPTESHSWLWDSVNVLLRAAKPSRRKRDRVVPADELLAFGQELMNNAFGKDPLLAAVQYRDGLIVCLLAARPLRIRNLQMMDFGRHLVEVDDRYFLRFTPAETKTKKAIDQPLPSEFIEWVNTYRETYRPVLLAHPVAGGEAGWAAADERAVWITKFGTRPTQWTLYSRMVEVTEKQFGKRVNPHLFRDCAATSIALNDPEHLDITMSLLGHTTRATGERYYNQALNCQAVSLHQKMISNLRHQYRRDDA